MLISNNFYMLLVQFMYRLVLFHMVPLQHIHNHVHIIKVGAFLFGQWLMVNVMLEKPVKLNAGGVCELEMDTCSGWVSVGVTELAIFVCGTMLLGGTLLVASCDRSSLCSSLTLL